MTKEPAKNKGSSPDRAKRKPPKLGLEWTDDNVLRINAEGDFQRLFDVLPNAPLTDELFGQIAKLGSPGRVTDEAASNFVLGFLDSMNPKDAAEALLMTQMAAIHQATMTMARRLNHTVNIPQQDAAERALNKLARSYAAQMDTLKRYRSKGQQTVRVERVTVESGAQAVVGNVNTGGRGSYET